MILTIDAGNTNVVFAILKGETVKHAWRVETRGEESSRSFYGGFEAAKINPKDIEGGILASVVPGLNSVLQQNFKNLTGKELATVGEKGVQLGIAINIENPKQVGADRLMNALAGGHYYGVPAIVIDFGTATTFDVVGKDGAYLGGAIAPGARMSLKTLHNETEKLPLIELAKPDHAIGKNTDEAIKSGIFWGYIGLIEGMVARIRNEIGEKAVTVATGGDAGLFAKQTDAIRFHRDDLTMQGLRLVYERNMR